MRIINLKAQNIKRLKAINITPDKNVVILKGNNGAGKSSVLDAIQMALGGSKSIPKKPIRDGQKEAEIVLELDGIVVERHWTSDNKSYLEVRGEDGQKIASPQAILDKLTGALAFDPLALLAFEPKKQIAILAELLGIDLQKFDDEHKRIFEERSLLNKEIKRIEAKIEPDNDEDNDLPEAEISITSLIEALTLAESERSKIEDIKRELDHSREDHKSITASIANLKAQIVEKEKRLIEVTEKGKALSIKVKDIILPDTELIKNKIQNADKTNKSIREKQAKKALIASLKETHKASEDLTQKLEDIKLEKSNKIKSVKFPVEGLSFGDDCLLSNGIPLNQASSAEQLKVSVAMGLALNPNLKIMLIRDGSLLDQNNLKIISEMAKDSDAQVWIEIVGKENGPAGIIIEDGEVEGAQPAITLDAEAEPEKPRETKSNLITNDDMCPF
jgi:DNA repair exonuclease SbcCD ATPase subunit